MKNFQSTAKNSHSHSVSIQRSRPALAVALIGFCAFLNLYALQPLLPLFTQIFHASKVEVSLTVSATTAGVALSALWVGVVADTLGRKRLIVPALLMLSLFTGLAATSSGLSISIVWRFLQGIVMAIVFAVTIAYVSEEWKEERVGAIMAMYTTGNVLGGFSGRVLSGWIAETFSWHWALIVLSGLTSIGTLISWAWLPNSRHFVPRRTMKLSLQSMNLHLRNPQLFTAYAVGFNILFSAVSLFTYINFYLSAPPFNLNTVALGLIFFTYLFGAIVIPIAGRWIVHLGYRLSLVLTISAFCVGVLLTLVPSIWIVLLGLAVCASGIAICQTISISYVGTTAREARSSATGLYVSAYYIGGSLGAVLPGFFWDVGHWLGCVGLILCIQVLTVSLATTYWKK